MKLNKKLKCVTVGMIALQGLSVVQPMTTFADDEDWNYQRKGKHDCDEDKEDKGKSTAETPAGVNGDWLTEGSDKYNVAKKAFETMTKEYGFSGAYAAGMLANIKGESDFQPDIGEGGKRMGMNEKDGATYNSANPGALGGGGLFQFTPYTKFSHSEYWQKHNKSEGWAPENQIAYVWDSEFKNKQVQTYYNHHASSGQIGGASDAVSRLGKFGSIEDALSTDDPAKAVVHFQIGYERPQTYHKEREEWAKQANAVFNKDNIKADSSKWKFDGGSSGQVDEATKNAEKKEDVCEVKTSKAGWGDDGTGSHHYGNMQGWKHDALPDDLKKYAIDPESLGMKFRSSEGWPNPGNQCAHFSESLFSLIWTKDGNTPAAVVRTPLGKDEAYNHSSAYGGSVSKTPVKGAISGQPPNADSPYAGHTYIVSHVFENGDILTLEQNSVGLSGANNSETCTWNYRIVSKSTYTKEGHTYYSPEKDGYKPNSKIKMLGS